MKGNRRIMGEPQFAAKKDQEDAEGQNFFTNGPCCENTRICTEKILSRESIAGVTTAKDGDVREKATFRLAWWPKGKQHKHDVVSFESGAIATAVRSSTKISLLWESPPQSVCILCKPSSSTVMAMCREMSRWLKEEYNMTIYIEPRVRKALVWEDPSYSFLRTWEEDGDVYTQHLHKHVDLVITLGGDGTMLWAATLFKGPIPPVVAFSMGSLGFMTPFRTGRYKESLQTVIKGPIHITLRHRLHCQIMRNCEDEGGTDTSCVVEDHLVLNEVAIDRGMSSWLTNLEVYCDNLFVTHVQGDGLILSTPSGSTAYSLAAGGSMVHPEVPAILLTPICPHSLSFRPLILPEYVTLRVQVPAASRGQAWASFDGKDRRQLTAGDALVVNMSVWPVPAVCDEECMDDFFRSVREGLHWNLRKSQSVDGLGDQERIDGLGDQERIDGLGDQEVK